MSKIKLCKQAENLYIKGGLSVDEICQNIDIARRTIFYWKKKTSGIKFGIKNTNLKQNSVLN